VEGPEHLHGHRAGERLEQLAQDKADVEAFAGAAAIAVARCRSDQAKWEWVTAIHDRDLRVKSSMFEKVALNQLLTTTLSESYDTRP
jgi:hypothetical protein